MSLTLHRVSNLVVEGSCVRSACSWNVAQDSSHSCIFQKKDSQKCCRNCKTFTHTRVIGEIHKGSESPSVFIWCRNLSYRGRASGPAPWVLNKSPKIERREVRGNQRYFQHAAWPGSFPGMASVSSNSGISCLLTPSPSTEPYSF